MCTRDSADMFTLACKIKRLCIQSDGDCNGCPFVKDEGSFLSCIFVDGMGKMPEDWDIDAE